MLLAGAVLRITLNGDYTKYVRASLRPYIYVSCGILLLLGLLSIVSRRRKEVTGHESHSHSPRGPRIGWLLLVPTFAILLIAPPALGSFGVNLAGRTQSGGQSALGPLPPGNPVELSLSDYANRATNGSTLTGRTVRVVGFVTPAGGGSWYVARYIIVCCAADAIPVGARVQGASPPDADTWVAVTGTWAPSADGTPNIVASSVQKVETPSEPYL